MEFIRRHIQPIIKEETIDLTLQSADKYRDCGVISQTIVELIHKYKLTFPEIEKRLRKLNSDTYLIATNKGQLKGQTSVDVMDLKKKRPYWLWISVNGKEEADQTLKEFGISSYEENLERLKSTGILIMDEI